MIFLKSNHPTISITGRYESTLQHSYRFSFPAVSIKLRIKDSSVSVRMQDFGNDGMQNHFNVVVDGLVHSVIKLSNDVKDIPLYTKTDDNWHSIELFKRTESLVGECEFFGFVVDSEACLDAVEESALLVEFIGDSITCGCLVNS